MFESWNQQVQNQDDLRAGASARILVRLPAQLHGTAIWNGYRKAAF